MPEQIRPFNPEFYNKSEERVTNFDDLVDASRNYSKTYDINPPALVWRNDLVDVEGYINRQREIAFEMGGPTLHGFELIDASRLTREVRISNVEDTMGVNSEGRATSIQIDLDLMSKGEELPFRDESVGAIFASNLPYENDIPAKSIIEAN